MRLQASLFSILTFFLTGCSIAPLSGPTSAIPLGKDNSEFQASVAPVAASYSHGITDRLDVGGIVELQFDLVVAPFIKYSFLHYDESRLSLAAYGGVYYASVSSGYFVGPVASYQLDNWLEVYLVAKYNYVYWDLGDTEIESNESSLVNTFSWDDVEFDYWQMNLGLNLRVAKAFYVFGSAAVFVDGDYVSDAAPMFGVAWRF